MIHARRVFDFLRRTLAILSRNAKVTDMETKPSACCDYFRDGQIWFAVAPAGTTFIDGTDTKCSNPALIPSFGLVQLKRWIDQEGLVDLVEWEG